jgi:ribosomal protein S18 acetylase RimI-like enzyme
LIVRRYEARDRAAVRSLACDTADSGQPMERFFPDREVFADALTGYYTDICPDYSWVAEMEGTVVGYLTGCLDTRRYLRAMAFRIGPLAFLRAIGRGALWHPLTRRLISANLRDWRAGKTLSLDRFPAHLHLNFTSAARGQGAGRQLLAAFLGQVKSSGVPGVHAKVSAGNERARRFFENAGFTELGRESRFRFPDQPDVATFTIIYGLALR